MRTLCLFTRPTVARAVGTASLGHTISAARRGAASVPPRLSTHHRVLLCNLCDISWLFPNMACGSDVKANHSAKQFEWHQMLPTRARTSSTAAGLSFLREGYCGRIQGLAQHLRIHLVTGCRGLPSEHILWVFRLRVPIPKALA